MSYGGHAALHSRCKKAIACFKKKKWLMSNSARFNANGKIVIGDYVLG